MKKEDLVIGKWYTHENSSCFGKLTGKYGISEKDYFPSNNYIGNNHYYPNGSHFNWSLDSIREVSIEEIAKYLPKDHPDLLLINKIYELWN